MLKLRYREKVKKCSILCNRDKRNSIIALVRKAEAAEKCNDFAPEYCNPKELTGGQKPFDDHVRNINDRQVSHPRM